MLGVHQEEPRERQEQGEGAQQGQPATEQKEQNALAPGVCLPLPPVVPNRFVEGRTGVGASKFQSPF